MYKGIHPGDGAKDIVEMKEEEFDRQFAENELRHEAETGQHERLDPNGGFLQRIISRTRRTLHSRRR